ELFILKTVESDRLKKTLELNLLAGSGLWTDEQGLQKRLVKINTSLVYRQDKYNLLREETEGYSKLLTVLGALPPPPEDPSTHVKHIFSVIGYFDLDPNRVLDITLEAMEQQLWNTSYLTLLRMFRRASVAHILGFKLSQYHKCNGAEGAPSPPGTPASLYMLTAVLLTAQVLTLEQIFPYLSPSLEETAVAAAEKRAAQRKEVMGHGSYNLAAKKTDDATKAKSQDLAVDDGAAVSPDVPAAAFADGNQIVGVMAAALTLRSWNLAQDIQAKFLDKIDPYDFTSCCDALIALVEWRMAAVYAPIGFPRFSLGRSRVEPNDTSIADVLIPAGLSVAGSTDCGKMEEAGQNGETAGELAYSQCLQVESADVVVQEMMPMLLALGHHLAASPRVFTQLCRLLKSRVSTYGNITSTDEHDELKSIV
ncbi:THO2, partial [Symbiodinium microadriaticum]